MKIDNKPIRIAVEKAENEGISASEICRRLGYCMQERADVTRLNRRIGRKPQEGIYNINVDYDIALKIIKAIGYDPVDYGL